MPADFHHGQLGLQRDLVVAPGHRPRYHRLVIKRSFLDRPVPVLGQSLPVAAVLLIALVVFGSALLAFGARMGLPVLGLAPLTPMAVGGGHVWRLLTWAFFDVNGQNLVFGGLMLALFGRDLVSLWGGARYLAVCLGVAGVTGIATFLVGLLWRDVWVTQYLTIWPLTDALIIAWATLYPSRQILVMFVIPASGRNLTHLTVGIAAIFALMYGFSYFVPHFLAMGLMYAYLRGGALFRGLVPGQSSRQRKHSNLKLVDRTTDEPPRWVH